MSSISGSVTKTEAHQAAVTPVRSSLWRQALHRLLKNKLAMSGLIFIVFMLVACFAGPLFSPYADNKINPANMNAAPSLKHWLGTDMLGRDVLTRLLQAGRISLTVGIASMCISVIIGSVLGAVAAYYRGIVDQVIMRVADLLLTIPGLPILFIMGALLSEWKIPSEYRMYIVMLMLSFIGWPGLARLVRSQMLSIREREFMQAAIVLGLNDRRKLFNHMIPNIVPLLIVVATLSIGGAILSESVLSFFGLGVMPPTPTWGNMIDAANNLIDFEKHPWLWIPPGVAIFTTVIAINIFGDGLRDVLDPKQKR
ncbi:oligopeptide ABC transporter permease [Paenibacillus apiarius]|uniref:ABC transporter permease n=1 Tax=Paenibacillus apiarius TaxID=46240 RepID=A0ABT4DZF2_9BACL|nr:oligopeptide ABC transporter permease [Paenibacillus apiarius]MBN3524973.1 ABC transporter permease [Paenibacillus apiarius]MCY9515165.1 ABC transporter permease [Paenibacillus apiarius]MCY9522734.1 ABC transporter permease [Paenibacillus apiarius]MCY9552954.1 ABC transporter permease [Paenibacillus apiarius]MCY9557629.1 ABC transporter permease [Paenibacillus apiarius]